MSIVIMNGDKKMSCIFAERVVDIKKSISSEYQTIYSYEIHAS